MSLLGALSHSAAAVAFCVLTLLLWGGWQGGRQGALFIVAALASTMWSTTAAAGMWAGTELPGWLAYVTELVRDGAWLFALAGLAGGLLPKALSLSVRSLCPALLLAPFAVWYFSESQIAGVFGQLLAPAGIACAVVVLLLLEQIFRNSNATGRHGFRFLAWGLGGVYVYDLLLFSYADLFNQVSVELWHLRGLVNAALVPMIAIAARRNPQWALDVFVSRQVVLFTTSVVAVGLYLLLMAAGGYYLHRFGPWGAATEVVFALGAVAVLAVVLMSDGLRRRLRVFVHKHFYRNKYDYRIEWLRFVGTLADAADENMRRTSLRAIAQVFECEGALLYLRSSHAPHYEPVAGWPWSPSDVPGVSPVGENEEVIAALRDKHWVIDLHEYRVSPGFYRNMVVPAALTDLPGYRVVFPLLQSESLVGFVVLREPPPPFALTYEDRDLLLTLGRHVALILVQQEAERRLAEARQFEAYHRLTAFMMHDLKNLVSQLDLVVSNAVKHRHNQEFVDDAFSTVANAADRMSQLISQLRSAEARGELVTVSLLKVLQAAVKNCQGRQPQPVFADVAEEDARHLVVLAEESRLISVIEHVIRNAQDASPGSHPVVLALTRQGDRAVIEVRDRGAGMTAEFIRTHLFRPFSSTKGSKGMGIGAYQVLEYVRSLGGDVEVQSTPGQGTTFLIKLRAHE
jgi:putative PEP-CTERM system histidine kinase